MQDKQTAGLDLPLKVLAWEDAHSAVWLTYNDLAWLAQAPRLGGGQPGGPRGHDRGHGRRHGNRGPALEVVHPAAKQSLCDNINSWSSRR